MSYVYIPDPNLKAAINYELDPSRPPEKEITDAEMLSLTKLNSVGKKIVNLTGLQTATNLTQLDLSFNQINDLSPLSSLINLTSLVLESNPISDFSPLSSLINLIELNLSRNQLNDLSPLSSLINLTYLDLSYSQLNDLSPLSSLINLTTLVLRLNQLNDLSFLSSLTNLLYLDLSQNQINDLSPLSSLIDLTTLGLSNNQINDLSPLSSLINLTYLDLSYNQINDLSPLSSLINLLNLDLTDNQISDLSPLSSLINLTTLDLDDNQISDLSPLSSLIKLYVLKLSYNQISDITSLSSLIKLNYLNLSRNQISDLSPLKTLKHAPEAYIQTVVTKGDWNNGTLTISTTILKNLDGSTPNIINNIKPTSGVYNPSNKTVTWKPISYNTEASFDFVGKDTFSGTVTREGTTGPKALQLQLRSDCNTLVNYDEPIIFNKTIYANAIAYDATTGIITFTSSGLYSINWWVAGIESGNTATFAIQVIGGEQIIGNANNHPGQVSGNAIIEVITAPISIQLINLTKRCGQPAWVLLSHKVPVQADISIVDYFGAPF